MSVFLFKMCRLVTFFILHIYANIDGDAFNNSMWLRVTRLGKVSTHIDIVVNLITNDHCIKK